MNSLMLWPDRERDLAEVARVLAPGGLVVLVVRDHTVQKKYGGLTRPEIDQVVRRLEALGFAVTLEHEDAVAFISARRRS